MNRLVLGIVALLPAAGCGYHTPTAGDAWVGGEGRVLHVELFANRTVEPYLDTIVTDEVTAQLSRSRLATLVEDRGAADLLLTGTVTGFASQVAAYDTNDRISEYQARMTVNARLTRRSDGSVLWQEELSRSETYAARLDKGQQQGEESQAARVVAKRIAEDLLARLLTVF
jgi:outer membrane lipopolysaccharide assembly protein LptE/RlpB